MTKKELMDLLKDLPDDSIIGFFEGQEVECGIGSYYEYVFKPITKVTPTLTTVVLKG